MTKPSNIDQKAVIVDHLTDKYLLLHCDVMYANNLPFLKSVAKPIKMILWLGIVKQMEWLQIDDQATKWTEIPKTKR